MRGRDRSGVKLGAEPQTAHHLPRVQRWCVEGHAGGRLLDQSRQECGAGPGRGGGEPVNCLGSAEADVARSGRCRAKWLWSGNRVMSPTSTSSRRAAPEGPMPCSPVKVVPVAASSCDSSLFAAFFRA